MHFCLVTSPSGAKLASGLSGSGIWSLRPRSLPPIPISAAEKLSFPNCPGLYHHSEQRAEQQTSYKYS